MSGDPKGQSHSPPVPLVALATWFIPGAGYLLLGQKARGITIGVTVLSLFALGLLIGGLHVIDMPAGFSFDLIMRKPWFIGQALAGIPALVTGFCAEHYNFPVSHARMNEIGTLYTAIAGMLNLMAVIDSSSRAMGEPQARGQGSKRP